MKTTFSNLRFNLTVILGVVLGGLLLPGCSKQPDVASTVANGKVIMKGSNTIGEELAPRLIAEYKKEHHSVTFELESKATGYGLAALMAGQCDIAGASRVPIKEELETAHSRNIELNDHIIGYYNVAVIVNAANPLSSLTRDQVRDIFTGVVQNWKEVGGSDAPIQIFIRDAISGTHLGFKELAMENKQYASGTTSSTNYASISHNVAQHPNAIGYCSFDQSQKDGVKAIAIQTVALDPASVRDGKYPYARSLHFYTNKASESADVQDFLKFVDSPRGQEILAQTGFIPRQ